MSRKTHRVGKVGAATLYYTSQDKITLGGKNYHSSFYGDMLSLMYIWEMEVEASRRELSAKKVQEKELRYRFESYNQIDASL